MKFDGNLISLYLSGMIRANKGSVKDTADYLEHMLKIDKEGKDFWNAVYSLLKKLHKKDLGENKMAKKKKENLDEGMVMMASLLPVGEVIGFPPKRKDNFKFKGLPGQFNENGEKILDEEGNKIKVKAEQDNPIKVVVKEEQDYKYYKNLLADVEDGLNELVNIGEDGSVFKAPKHAHKSLKQAYTLVNKVK